MLYTSVLSLVSLFCNRVLLLLFIPEYLRFITLNTLSTLFLLEYISFLNIFWLNLRYHPCLKFAFNGIWSKALISSLMQFLMGYVSYALSAIMYWSLYFFRLLITAIANFVSCLGPLTACEYKIILDSTSIAIWHLV